ncbi:MAG: helix-turn-helix transcriptional regulator [Bacteroidales bacterium]|nr:helix-turn-helix transcriptional regulator [Bacteroidales bacterium]
MNVSFTSFLFADLATEVHIGKEIRKVMKQRRITVVEVAAMLNLHRQSVYDMLSRDNIDVKRLALISELLDYDFYNALFGKND